MNPLQTIAEKTNELKALLGQVSKGNRLEVIEKVNDLLDERELLLKQLDLAAVKKDPLVEKLLLEESSIKTKMQQILMDIKKDLHLIRNKRKSGESYINPYQSLRVDGVFFDKKK